MTARHPQSLIRDRGVEPYAVTWSAMRDFTERREPATADEIWLVQHPPVYTQGLGGRAEHVGNIGATPLVRSDRGGQVTWHGPGQQVAYVLVDLRRLGLGPRELVRRIEDGVINALAVFGLAGERRSGAPGVYVDGAKCASLGLRVRRGCSYHGVAVNVDNTLEPFSRIDPCGFAGLAVTRMVDQGVAVGCAEFAPVLARSLVAALYDSGPDAGAGDRRRAAPLEREGTAP